MTASLVNGVTDVLKSEIYKPGTTNSTGGNPGKGVQLLRTAEIELQDGRWVTPTLREHYRTTQIR